MLKVGLGFGSYEFTNPELYQHPPHCCENIKSRGKITQGKAASDDQLLRILLKNSLCDI
jgi:hypothetical protein